MMIDPDIISGFYVAASIVAFLTGRIVRRHITIGAVLLAIPACSTLRWNMMFLDPHWALRSIQMATPCMVSALALYVLGNVRPWPALAAWLLLTGFAADVGAVPNPAGVYRAAHLCVLAAGLAAIVARYPFWRSQDEPDVIAAPRDLTVTDICTIVLVAQWGAGDIVAAYLHEDPWAEHRFVQRLALAVCAALVVLQGGYLWRRHTRSSAASLPRSPPPSSG